MHIKLFTRKTLLANNLTIALSLIGYQCTNILS